MSYCGAPTSFSQHLYPSISLSFPLSQAVCLSVSATFSHTAEGLKVCKNVCVWVSVFSDIVLSKGPREEGSCHILHLVQLGISTSKLDSVVPTTPLLSPSLPAVSVCLPLTLWGSLLCSLLLHRGTWCVCKVCLSLNFKHRLLGIKPQQEFSFRGTNFVVVSWLSLHSSTADISLKETPVPALYLSSDSGLSLYWCTLIAHKGDLSNHRACP